MEIGRTFNTTKEEIENKNFNIFVPICVGNKFFLDNITPTKTIYKYIEWALERTKEKVLVLIVDEIQITNWIVRNSNIPQEQNMRRLMRKGEGIKEKFEELIGKFSEKEKGRIRIIRWEDYRKNDLFCDNTTKAVYKEFKNNLKFREEILKSVKTSITDRTFEEKDYVTLCNYVLDEFSLAYHGTKFNKTYYNLYVYPYTDEVLEIIEKIKEGKIFLELSKQIDKSKTAVALLK